MTIARSIVLGAAAALLVACGGGQTKVQPPPTGSGEGVAAGTAVPNAQGQQVVMGDSSSAAPTPAPAPATPIRSSMNGAAADAYSQGTAAFASGDLAGAKNAFQRAASADSHAYQAYYSLGVVQERLEDGGALGSYRQAYTIQSDYEPAIVAAALLMARKGSVSEAESFLNGKRGQLPNSAAVIAALAEVKSIEKDTASAQQLAQEALKKNSDYRPAMVTLARDHYRNRRLDLALYALQAILDGFGDDNPARDKDNAEAHYLRALILREEGGLRRSAAIAEFKRAVDLRPDLVGAREDLAGYYLEAGNATDAQPLLEGALRYNPNDAIAHLNLGDCYRLLGRINDAKAQFDWVMMHDNSLPQVHYDLALLYLFSPNVAGLDAKKQAQAAIDEITKYQQLRARSQGQTDDSDELLSRAKQKLSELSAETAQPAASSGGAPAPSAPNAKQAAPATGSDGGAAAGGL
jgi:tetratricopeptide (TPR) repeat protein